MLEGAIAEDFSPIPPHGLAETSLVPGPIILLDRSN